MRAIKQSLLGVTAAAVVQFSGGTAAEASTLTYHGFAAPGSETVEYTIDSISKRHRSGAFAMKDEDGNSLLAFCIDLFNVIKSTWDYTAGDSFIPVKDQANIAAVTSNMKKLFTAHFDEALTSSVTAAAFQLALWEISVDTTGVGAGLSLLDGRMIKTADGAVYDKAAEYLDSVTADAAEGGYKLTFWDSNGSPEGRVSQNLVAATPVPLPAGLLLLGTGMAGLGLMRRRRHD